MVEMFTITQLARKAQGTGITMHAIRKACQSGELPTRRIGVKYLISWDNFVKWATGEDSNNDGVLQGVHSN